jgi:hypothetical protein
LLASFAGAQNQFIKRKIGNAVAKDVKWWRTRLAKDDCGSKLEIPPKISSNKVFVDASTSWGIGLVVNGEWCTWKLKEGWKVEGCNIGWAEMVAVELAVWMLIAMGKDGCHLHVWLDNAGVVGALKGSQSWNAKQNSRLQQILGLFIAQHMWLSIGWVSTEENLADAPSRGKFPPVKAELKSRFALLEYLTQFVELV